MNKKQRLRKKYFTIRKKKYFDIKFDFFKPLNKVLDKGSKNKRINLSIYYPSLYEVNTLKLFECNFKKKINIFLPVLKDNSTMHFHEWRKGDILRINKYGMMEPAKLSKHVIPEIMLLPMLAFDKNKNRLGYGGGFYDRYLNKYLKKNKNILAIGVAFSFQKNSTIPSSDKDVKLDHVLTEKGIF